ncbi:MAG TPA: MFS transporter [Lacipirellula sp.]
MPRNHLVFAAACMGMLLFGIVFLSLGAANNMLAARFKLDDNAIGTLTALLPLGILIGSLVFGPVVDRFGYRWPLVAASLIVGTGLEGLAFGDTERLVQFSIFLVGFGGGVLNGATNALAADVSEGDRGAKLSLLGVFFGIGALTMPSTLAALSQHLATSHIIAGVGALVLIPAAYSLVIPFPPPKQRAEKFSLTAGLALLRDPIFLIAGLALAIQSGMEGMSNDWMTRYFSHVALAGRSGVEWMTQLGLVAVAGAMMVTRLVLAAMLTRLGSRRVLLASVAVTALGAVTLQASGAYLASLAGAVMIGCGLAAAFPVVLGYIGDLYPQQSGTAFSTIFVLALTGNMIINKTFGYVAQQFGVANYARMMLACLACSAVLLLLIFRRLDRRHQP